MTHASTSGLSLLSFRVGGVQEFIDSARTTEDFWASSYLISYLTKTAATALLPTESLIFPSISNTNSPVQQRIADFPNGILAIVDSNNARNLATGLKAAFTRNWQEAMRLVNDEILQLTPNSPAHTVWIRQAELDYFETFWAITEFSSGEPYETAYRRASATIESCKLLRDFESTREPDLKCSQCGRLQALHNGKHTAEFWEWMAERGGRVSYRFRPKERLCAVCVTCRLFSRTKSQGQKLKESQPSTSSIAVNPFVTSLFQKAAAVAGEVEAFVNCVKAIDPKATLSESPYLNLQNQQHTGFWHTLRCLDGDWFYAPTYEERYLEKERNLPKVPEPKRKAALQALSRLTGKANEKPGTYAVLVAMDGDRVGGWITGEVPGETPTIDTHKLLSLALSKIGPAAQPVIENQFQGRLIYSGGDDLLFMLPAEGLAAALEACLSAVKQAMIGVHPKFEKFTFSAAALVLPHNDSLSGAIREVETQLRSEAKETFGRNCVVISARRQSGQRTVAAFPWKVCPDFQALISALSVRHGIAPVLASHFAEISRGLGDGIEPQQLEEMSLFLLDRHCPDKKLLEKQRIHFQRLVNVPLDWGSSNPGAHIEQSLLTARFLARAGRDLNPSAGASAASSGGAQS